MNSKMAYSQKTFFSIVVCFNMAAMTLGEKYHSSHVHTQKKRRKSPLAICAPTRPSCHVIENHLFYVAVRREGRIFKMRLKS